MSLALDVLLSEHRGCPTEVSFCCSVGFFVDFEKDPVFVHIGPTVSLKAKDVSNDRFPSVDHASNQSHQLATHSLPGHHFL